MTKSVGYYIVNIMLRLSTKGQYGVRAMYEIARGYPGKPTTIKQIAQRQDVSIAYLEQILSTLRRAGLVSSIRGPGGGYVLAAEPGETSIGAILAELEGPVAITSCLDPAEGCARVDSCVTHLLWKSLGEKIQSFLNTITLAELLNEEALLAQAGVKGTIRMKGKTGAGDRAE